MVFDSFTHIPLRVSTLSFHGLTGRPFESWADEKAGVYWPVHLLPQDFPEARILSFGYDADVARFLAPVGQCNLREHATSLLNDIAAFRHSDGNVRRKIIFLAHSLGGLVVKKAISLSETAAESDVRKLQQDFFATFFFGTPHRGSDLAPLTNAFVKVIKMSRYPMNQDIVRVLQRDSEVLAEVEESFAIWLRRNSHRFHVVSFYEEREIPVIGLVVTKESAKVAGWDQLPIPANHMNMIRFADSEDLGYMRIKGQLKRKLVLARSAEVPPLSRDEKACLTSLAFPEMNDGYNAIQPGLRGTGEWLSNTSEYREWLPQKTGLLLVKGKPGSGKSTVMRHLVDTLKLANDTSLRMKTISFFVTNRGSKIQNSPEGIYRSLLHQIMVAFPACSTDMVSLYKSRCETMGSAGEGWRWHANELEEFLERCVLRVLDRSSLQIVVDALDECEIDTARGLARVFQRILEVSATSQFGLKVCFSCRHFPNIILSRTHLEVRVEDENTHDIQHFIKRELDCEVEAGLEPLVEEIEARADGVFLWVALMLPDIVWKAREGRDVSELRHAIEETPAQLDTLYASTLAALSERDKSRSKRLFQWLSFSFQPLTVSQLRWAILVEDSPDLTSFEQLRNKHGFIADDNKMKLQIGALSCGLAEIRKVREKTVVQLIHGSVKDYIVSSGLSQFESSPSERDCHVVGKSHYQIYRTCIRFFTMDEIQNEIQGLVDPNKFRQQPWNPAKKILIRNQNAALMSKIQDQYPLFFYTFSWWLEHCQLAERSESLGGDFLEGLTLSPNRALQILTEAHFAYLLQRRRFSTPLHHAVKYHLHSVLSRLQNEGKLQLAIAQGIRDTEGNTLLIHAAKHGNFAAAQKFQECGAALDVVDSHGRNALCLAAEGDLHHTLQRSITTRALEVTPPWFDGRADYAAIVTLLLEKAPATANHRDSQGRTALYYAAFSGARNLFELVLSSSSKAALKLRDNEGQTPLFFAILGGSVEMIQLFRQRKEVEFDTKDGYGMTPLSWLVNLSDSPSEMEHSRATRWNALAAVKLLLSYPDIEVDSKDNLSRSPLAHAAASGHYQAVELFLESGRADVNAQDEQGFTALALVCDASPANAEETIRVLLQAPNININLACTMGTTPLARAVRRRSESMVSLLLAHQDILPDLADRNGRTPLSWATEELTAEEVIGALLGAGARVDAMDKDGMTPLSRALKQGFSQRVITLMHAAERASIPTLPGSKTREGLARSLSTDRDDFASKESRQRAFEFKMHIAAMRNEKIPRWHRRKSL
ncbi:hypothetical protein BJY04DRAFT_196939 [Aspergillus karnatakaensis]|uniref:uncharacterized protein n=1 Tax=Aspergillus karnatakaensis TaxID=1810916 RepID=UPI003CCD61F7